MDDQVEGVDRFCIIFPTLREAIKYVHTAISKAPRSRSHQIQYRMTIEKSRVYWKGYERSKDGSIIADEFYLYIVRE